MLKKLKKFAKKVFFYKKAIKLKSKTAFEYFKELDSFIKSFDVNSLKLKEEYLWPYIRNKLWIQLYGISNGDMRKVNLLPTAIQRGSNADLNFKRRKEVKFKYNAKEIDELDDEVKVDFLFITVINAAEQVELENGEIYHRITDPFYEIASKMGSTKKIEILRVKSKALEKSKKYFHKVLYVLPPAIYRYGYRYQIKFGKTLTYLKRKIPSIEHNGEALRQFIDWELHTRDFYIELFKKVNPKVVFLNGFHFQAPLISAAHSLGILTVDIQHGIQIGWNPLYNDWKEMPKEGYQALPDYFFVWSKKEFESNKRVFKGEKHKPMIVGFPWLDRQLELTNRLDSEYIKKINKYKIKILIAMQKQPIIPKVYKDLINNSSDDFLWIIRHHPKGNRFKAEDFNKENSKNIIIDKYIDNVSLGQLFKHINIVISEGSTVAAEADYAGLYNFIVGKKGKGNYVDEIDKGFFYYIKNYKEFFSTIKKLDLSKRVSRAELYKKVNLEKVFNLLLEEYNEKNRK